MTSSLRKTWPLVAAAVATIGSASPSSAQNLPLQPPPPPPSTATICPDGSIVLAPTPCPTGTPPTSTVPEPASLGLIGIGLVALGVARRRAQQANRAD